MFTEEVRVIVLLMVEPVDWGSDHSRRWSPDVARRSVDCFWDEGGSQSIRVTGYEHVASATRVYSRPNCGAPDGEASCDDICVSRIWIYETQLARRVANAVSGDIRNCACLPGSSQWPFSRRCCRPGRSICTSQTRIPPTAPSSCC